MRENYTLWRAKNGWLLLPSGKVSISALDIKDCTIFKSLKEFADECPKRERKPRTRKTKGGYAVNYTDTQIMPQQTKEPTDANIVER